MNIALATVAFTVMALFVLTLLTGGMLICLRASDRSGERPRRDAAVTPLDDSIQARTASADISHVKHSQAA